MKSDHIKLTADRARRLLERDDAKPSMYINDISKLFEYRLSGAYERKGVSHGYRKMLGILMDNDGISQLELVKKSGLSAPSVSIALSKLEAEDYVKRAADKTDYRKAHVYITEKGRAHVMRIRELCGENDAVMLKGITDEEIASVNAVLRKMLKNMLEEGENE